MRLIEAAKAVLNENHTYGYASLETLNKLEQAVAESDGMVLVPSELIEFIRANALVTGDRIYLPERKFRTLLAAAKVKP